MKSGPCEVPRLGHLVYRCTGYLRGRWPWPMLTHGIYWTCNSCPEEPVLFVLCLMAMLVDIGFFVRTGAAQLLGPWHGTWCSCLSFPTFPPCCSRVPWGGPLPCPHGAYPCGVSSRAFKTAMTRPRWAPESFSMPMMITSPPRLGNQNREGKGKCFVLAELSGGMQRSRERHGQQAANTQFLLRDQVA